MCKRIFIRKLTVNITLTNEMLEVCLPRLTRVCTATATTTKQKEKRTGKCCVSRWKHLPPSAERTHEMGPMPSHYDAFAFLLRNVIPNLLSLTSRIADTQSLVPHTIAHHVGHSFSHSAKGWVSFIGTDIKLSSIGISRWLHCQRLLWDFALL